MRKTRLTFQGAFHHITSRAQNGTPIFAEHKQKLRIIELILDECEKYKLDVYAYCIMDNHYHIVLQNTSGRLSDCMRAINGTYAAWYRAKSKEKGHVFQGRFNSQLIQDEPRMKMAILYDLLNPVRAGITENPYNYKYSSIHHYFEDTEERLNAEMEKELFSTPEGLRDSLNQWTLAELNTIETPYGDVIGDSEAEGKIKSSFERRGNSIKTSYNMRTKREFQTSQQVIRRFEKDMNLKISEINIKSAMGKKLRADLLIRLKDEAGMTFKEINALDLFCDMKTYSLSTIYRRYKKKLSD